MLETHTRELMEKGEKEKKNQFTVPSIQCKQPSRMMPGTLQELNKSSLHPPLHF